jgi:hypothetical protein
MARKRSTLSIASLFFSTCSYLVVSAKKYVSTLGLSWEQDTQMDHFYEFEMKKPLPAAWLQVPHLTTSTLPPFPTCS